MCEVVHGGCEIGLPSDISKVPPPPSSFSCFTISNLRQINAVHLTKMTSILPTIPKVVFTILEPISLQVPFRYSHTRSDTTLVLPGLLHHSYLQNGSLQSKLRALPLSQSLPTQRWWHCNWEISIYSSRWLELPSFTRPRNQTSCETI